MNIKIRLKNPIVWIQIFGSVLLTALGYNMMNPQDLTTWHGLFELIKGVVANPYLLGLCVFNAWNVFNDPTTRGIKDSERAMTYKSPM